MADFEIYLTDEEEKAVTGLMRAIAKLPKTLNLYVCDGTLTVCKKGVSVEEYAAQITTNVNACSR